LRIHKNIIIPENAVIKLENLKLATYDEDGNPSSRDKHPLLRAPGELRYVSGIFTGMERIVDGIYFFN
jgi:hypothetical protein